MKFVKGCKIMVWTVGLFGQKCRVPCGNKADGFMPDYCDKCQAKQDALHEKGEVKG